MTKFMSERHIRKARTGVCDLCGRKIGELRELCVRRVTFDDYFGFVTFTTCVFCEALLSVYPDQAWHEALILDWLEDDFSLVDPSMRDEVRTIEQAFCHAWEGFAPYHAPEVTRILRQATEPVTTINEDKKES